jgi:ferritin-like metal-binding protein YciE
MPAGTLRDLYENELLDLYAAEQQIISALPQMTAAAASPELKAALEKHLERTRIHVERLDFLFKQHGIGSSGSRPTGIEGAVQTGSVRIRENRDPDVRDAAIISAAQHIEHYEIAGYGCARTFARQLGNDSAADLLQQTLDEEGAADKELTRIAESGVNQAASIGASGGIRSDHDTRLQSRLRYVDVNDLPAAAEYRDVKIRNRAGDDLGRVDGFIVDSSGRPYYLVVDSGGLFVGRRYVVPIGRADLSPGERLLTIDLDKDTLKRYPEFRSEDFMTMSDEQARRYEWRVLEAVDPQAARSTLRDWNYDQFAYYRQPDWFDTGMLPVSSRSPRRGASPSREVPISTEQEDRERVIAREDTQKDEELRRERIRGTSDDDIR